MQGQLPAVWVLDKTGAVRYQVKGRMPAEAWDQVAELL
jgi:predicted transcriptional regulator